MPIVLFKTCVRNSERLLNEKKIKLVLEILERGSVEIHYNRDLPIYVFSV